MARALLVDLGNALGMRLAPAEPPRIDQLLPGSLESRRATAKSWIGARTARNKMFGAEMLANPAWDMMLDLYEKHLDGVLLSVTSACLASPAPPATSFRYLNMLIERGWVERKSDPNDRRRVLVNISPMALEMMNALMDGVLAGHLRMLGIGV